ncbi:MAG: gliding motility-associated C-terminal domain-containing protein [Bacteroidetes bacterium]|nr:MAG: gliding motility-associated C-terminal domain-containing protein [Bacteroidota bacterium]
MWLTPQVVGTPPFQYSWLLDPPAEGSCTDCAELLLRPLDTTLVRLTVTDASGCTATARTVVPVEKDYRVFVPNAFSPNDDGFNDRFLPFGKQGTEVVRLQVFDRWGELVYDVREVPAGDYPSGWDGTFHGRPMPAGVYVWRALFRFLDGYEVEQSGDLLLLR